MVSADSGFKRNKIRFWLLLFKDCGNVVLSCKKGKYLELLDKAPLGFSLNLLSILKWILVCNGKQKYQTRPMIHWVYILSPVLVIMSYYRGRCKKQCSGLCNNLLAGKISFRFSLEVALGSETQRFISLCRLLLLFFILVFITLDILDIYIHAQYTNL